MFILLMLYPTLMFYPVSLFFFLCFFFFFFNDTATTEIYTLSLHDALPISLLFNGIEVDRFAKAPPWATAGLSDRKSTRLNSSHTVISYAVFCLKKKKKKTNKKILPRIQ